MTSVSDSRWHRIQSPTSRLTELETRTRDHMIGVYEKIAAIHHAIGDLRFENEQLKERVEQLELELDHYHQFTPDG